MYNIVVNGNPTMGYFDDIDYARNFVRTTIYNSVKKIRPILQEQDEIINKYNNDFLFFMTTATEVEIKSFEILQTEIDMMTRKIIEYRKIDKKKEGF